MRGRKMKFQKKFVFFFVLLAFVGAVFGQSVKPVNQVEPVEQVAGNSIDKMDLQEETFEVLNQLDHLLMDSKSLNALFSDQSEENFNMYEAQFCLVNSLVEKMDDLQKRWEKHIKLDRNDKVLRVFTATVQLAMYSIYSRPERYMGFLKVFKQAERQLKCFAFFKKIYEKISLKENTDAMVYQMLKEGSQEVEQPNLDHLLSYTRGLDKKVEKKSNNGAMDDPDILSYRDRADDWEIRAEAILEKARVNIDWALELDSQYVDALILDAQLLVLEANYQEAKARFDELDNKKLFKEKRSLLTSWQAFMELMEGSQEMGKSRLKLASAYSEPALNSDWAFEYLKLFKSAQSKWIVFNFNDFDLLKEGNLKDVSDKSYDSALKVLTELEKPIANLPRHLNDKVFDRISRGRRKLFYTLNSDTSKRNLKKFAKLIENLYDYGSELHKCMGKWHELSNKSKFDARFFYWLNWSNCAFVLNYMVENTMELVDNDLLNGYLTERLKRRGKGRKVDFLSQWKEWRDEVGKSLPDVLEKMREPGKNSVYFQILDFEYEAFFGDVDLALNKLDAIEKMFEIQDRRQLQLQSNNEKINVNAFIVSWKSSLLLKKGKFDEAEELLGKIENWEFLTSWRANQEKLIFIKSRPPLQLQSPQNSSKITKSH